MSKEAASRILIEWEDESREASEDIKNDETLKAAWNEEETSMFSFVMMMLGLG